MTIFTLHTRLAKKIDKQVRKCKVDFAKKVGSTSIEYYPVEIKQSTTCRYKKTNAMKAKIYAYISLFAIVLIIQACTIEKRHYRPGYNVQWRSRKEVNSKLDIPREKDLERNISASPVDEKAESVTASTETHIGNSALQFQPKLILSKSRATSRTEIEICDEVILKNGDTFQAKVIEIGVTEIKYKKCNNLEGPTVSILKSDVFLIKYANGTKEVFKENDNIRPNESAEFRQIGSTKSEMWGTETNGNATASLVLGIIGLCLLPVIGGILAVALGSSALKEIERNPNKYSMSTYKTAKAGVVMGWISIAWAMFLFILILGAIA
jgi:hypothetical protein